MEEYTMKKFFVATIALIAVALSMPAFAATNGGVSTWLQVQNNDMASARNYYGVETWDMSLQDMSATDMVAFGPGASAQAARDVSFANVPDVVTIVNTATQGVASAPSWKSFAGLQTGSETDISVPGVDVQLAGQMGLTTNGGVASGQSGSSVVIFNSIN